MRVYSFKWKRFLAWLETHHPEVQTLREVTREIGKEYAKDLGAEKLSASTFNQHKNLLKMVWRVLTDECKLAIDPWEKIQPKKLTPLDDRKHSLEQHQFESLLAIVEKDQDLHDLFTFLAWTGLRLADAVLMKWGAVDFKAKVITVTPIKTARRQGKQVYITIFPAVLEILNRRQLGQVLNPNDFVFPALAEKYNRDPTAISKTISDAFDKAGMQTTQERADRKKAAVVYGAHSFRHLFVTAAASEGMPAVMIKSITGHESDKMLEHYQQIGSEMAAGLATRIYSKGTKRLSQTGADQEPLPQWARKLLETMNEKNWEKVKKKLLKQPNSKKKA